MDENPLKIKADSLKPRAWQSGCHTVQCKRDCVPLLWHQEIFIVLLNYITLPSPESKFNITEFFTWHLAFGILTAAVNSALELNSLPWKHLRLWKWWSSNKWGFSRSHICMSVMLDTEEQHCYESSPLSWVCAKITLLTVIHWQSH